MLFSIIAARSTPCAVGRKEHALRGGQERAVARRHGVGHVDQRGALDVAHVALGADHLRQLVAVGEQLVCRAAFNRRFGSCQSQRR
jgi:hypothetical protein